MGLLGTDYTLKPGHFLFFVLTASSVILGFNYFSEMNQRIQFQENMMFVKRQTQRILEDRSNIQRKAAELQRQLDNVNKEMEDLKDIQFQMKQQSANFEKEKNELLDTLSLKEDEVIEVQYQYKEMKQRFELISSVMGQFEKNQSRLLEKFSTQSTQCMNVINMMSELCKKGKNNFQNIRVLTKKIDTLTDGITVHGITVSPVTIINETEESSLDPPEEHFKTNQVYGMEHSVTHQTTASTILNSDDKQSSQLVKQALQALGYVAKNSSSTGDKNNATTQDKIDSHAEEKELKSQNKKSQESQKDDDTAGKKLVTEKNKTKDISLNSNPKDIVKANQKPETEQFVTLQNTGSKNVHSDDKQSSQKLKQDLQALTYGKKNTTSAQHDEEDDDEDDTEQENIHSPTEKEVVKSQKKDSQGGSNDNTEKALIKETVFPINNTEDGQKQSIQQLRKYSEKQEKLPNLAKALQTNQTKLAKGSYVQNISDSEATALKHGSLQVVNENNKTSNRSILVKVANETSNTTLPAGKTPNKEIIRKYLTVNVYPRKLIPEKIETSDDTYNIERKHLPEIIREDNDNQNDKIF